MSKMIYDKTPALWKISEKTTYALPPALSYHAQVCRSSRDIVDFIVIFFSTV